MIHRNYNISKSQSFFLFGPRGSGKSTWLKTFFTDEHVLWIDLLVQKTEHELSLDPDRLLEIWLAQPKTKWIIIDEVQKIPRLLDVVHRGIEEYKIKFALTGSSARKLRRGGANLLAGRAIEKQMYPFSSIELGEKFNLDRALSLGLLPKIWNDDDNTATINGDYLYTYVQTYLKEEIAAEQLVRQLDPFRRFLVCAAQSNGKIVNYAKIERDTGVSSRQALRHFEILVDTLIGFYLEPFHFSARKRQTAKSKFYFFDTGVIRALQNLVEEPLTPSTYEYGNLFETFIINEFVKLRAALNFRWNFSYLQTANNLEIDLIIEKPKGKNILIEIKSGTKIDQEAIGRFAKLKKDIPHEKAYLISNCNTGLVKDGIHCMHWQDALKEIFALSGG